MPNPVWSFDIGTSSLGYAVRGSYANSLEFAEVDTLLIPDGFASIQDAAFRRRALRNRQAHSAREAFLRQFFNEHGLAKAVLSGRRVARVCPICGQENASKMCFSCKKNKRKDIESKWQQVEDADSRLEREFPASGDETVYCGALLRYLLLQGHALEPWQIFKAFHSAIQKRGYEPDVPWKNSRSGKEQEDDSGVTTLRMSEMEQVIQELPEGYQYPCVWEIRRMGLWSPEEPKVWRVRIDHTAQSAKWADRADPAHRSAAVGTLPAVYPRTLVEAELRAMFAKAEQQLPQLRGKADEFLYGPAGLAFGSYHINHPSQDPAKAAAARKELGHIPQGKSADWQGVLAQKVPTFDNRGPVACRLFPNLRVAKAAPRLADGEVVVSSLLPAEATFLMKLKHFRFVTGETKRGFTAEEIHNIFAERTTAAKKAFAKKNTVESYLGQLKLTQTQLARVLERLCGEDFTLSPDQNKIEEPKPSGRSSFSRPACRIIKTLVLSGLAPDEFRRALLDDPDWSGLRDQLFLKIGHKNGLAESSLDFLNARQMGESWEGLYLPDSQLASVRSLDGASQKKREEAVASLIGKQLDPVVRHRLGLFHTLLKDLEERHGAPEHIVLEFVREDFMGERAKLELAKFQKKRREERAHAREQVGADNRMALRAQLLRAQGGHCLFTGRNLTGYRLDELELEHIVPRSKGGPNAYYNFVITDRAANRDKGERTPFEWLGGTSAWGAYLERVNSSRLTTKKRRLLTDENAVDLVSRYQTLAETAWIAKLARTIACIHFGWPLNAEGQMLRIRTLPGGLTNKVARKYDLYTLLGDSEREKEYQSVVGNPKSDAKAIAKAEADYEKKLRSDKRHHALDAMILSFLPQWAADHTKRIHHKLPQRLLDQDPLKFFGRVLEEVVPHQVVLKKSELEDGIYGVASLNGKLKATIRRQLSKIAYTGLPPKFKVSTLRSNIEKIAAPEVQSALSQWLNRSSQTEEEWRAFSACLTLPNGTKVKRVKMFEGDTKEYADLSKDQNGSLRRGKSHKGYFVYLNEKETPKVMPVYTHKSTHEVKESLVKDHLTIIDFFRSGHLIALERDLLQGKQTLAAGHYVLNSLWENGQASLTSGEGQTFRGIGIGKLIAAGFSKVS